MNYRKSIIILTSGPLICFIWRETIRYWRSNVIAFHWRNLLLVCQENLQEQWLSESSNFVV